MNNAQSSPTSTAIEHRSFGSTSFTTSVLGLGGGYLDQVSPEQGEATVHCALDLGIRYIDTSPMYCHGASQRILGKALAGRSEGYLLATKLGYLPKRAEFRDPAALWRQLEDNLRLLGRDDVDILQIHEADLSCWWLDDERSPERIPCTAAIDFAGAPAAAVLAQAKARGRCRHVGISGNSAPEMTRVLRELTVDTFLLAFNYNLLHRAARAEALPLARAKGAATLVGGLLQYGRLTHLQPQWLTHPPDWMTPDLHARYTRLYRLQQRCGISLAELTIRYVLADPQVGVILIGAAAPAHIEEAVKAAAAGPLPPDLHQEVEAI